MYFLQKEIHFADSVEGKLSASKKSKKSGLEPCGVLIVKIRSAHLMR